MITLLLSISLMAATPEAEPTTCRFLDEFYDYRLSSTEQQEGYIELDEVEFVPDNK